MSESAPFVPADFDPPTSFTAGDLRLEPLGPEHNERDYAAWTSSMEHIRRSPGFPDGNWPHEMSLDDNRGDLERHARDFVERRGFTFTVLDSSDDVVGCVYVYPARDGVHDASVQSWVRESEAVLDDAVRRAIADWLVSGYMAVRAACVCASADLRLRSLPVLLARHADPVNLVVL